MTIYRVSTESEFRRIGVPHRITGSRWYRSSNVACSYPVIKRYRWQDAIRAAKAQHTRELGAPQLFRLYGDGEHVAAVKRSRWMTDDQLAIALAEARYLDWLAARDNQVKLAA